MTRGPKPKKGKKPAAGFRSLPWILAALAVAAALTVLSRGRDGSGRIYEFSSEMMMEDATDGGGAAGRCLQCHQEQHRDWLSSQHALAQRAVGASSNQAFASQRIPEGQSVVPTTSWGIPGFRDKRTAEFWPARAAIGVTPLVQYLLPFPGGRFQIAPLSFDPRKLDWFDAQVPPRSPEDWSYFKNRGMNWNSQCAFCHTTDLRKNYDIAADSYSTTWSAVGISCSQCHGDVGPHLSDPRNPARFPRIEPGRVLDNCASCHARREELTGNFKPGELFADHYALALPDQPAIYYADGQVRDEDFEYGSLRLSRMGHKGVTCTDCHNPHSGRLKLPAENNALCMSCHSAPGQRGAVPIEPATHLFHAEGRPGSLCIDCHMPQSTYMARDARRDHGFTSPDPWLTLKAGIPNSCNRCHQDKPPSWALDFVNKWYGEEKMGARRARQRAIAILDAQNSKGEFSESLLAAARSEEIPAWKAALVLLLSPWSDRADVEKELLAQIKDPDPLVRAAAVKSLGANAVGGNRFPDDVFKDPVRYVRLEGAWQSALQGVAPPNVQELRRYVDNQSDQPAGALKQAQLALARSDTNSAVRWARKAAEWDQTSAAAQQMLAMVLYNAGQTAEAKRQFEKAAALEPESAMHPFYLGLLLAETGDLQGAIAAFERAVKSDKGYGRAWYNLGLALFQRGDTGKALEALREAEAAMPGSGDAAYAAATILIQEGDKKAALEALKRSLARDPRHAPSRQLRQELLR